MGGRPFNFIQIVFHSVLRNERAAARGRLFFYGYGWMDFMEHHSVRHGYTLHFRYAGGSKFRVRIFDRDCTEIVYPSAPILTEVQNNGIVCASAKIKSTIVECCVFDHGVPFFKKELSESAVSGRQPVALPASLLKDNKIMLNNKYKSCLVELLVGGRPKKGDVVYIFLDFDDEEKIPVFRISFDGRNFDFIRQVKIEV
ncbi:hypothetical protein ACFE04_003400 [Oxalis oulophora]